MQFVINYIAVLAAAIAAMVVGAAWFGMFSKQWLAAQGKSQKEIEKMMKMPKGDMKKSYLITFIGAILTALVLSILLSGVGAHDALSGAAVGGLVWLGFVAPIMAGGVLWEGRSSKLYTIDVAHQLLNLLVIGAILGAMSIG